MAFRIMNQSKASIAMMDGEKARFQKEMDARKKELEKRRQEANMEGTFLVDFDEMYLNIGSDPQDSRFINVKFQLELFQEGAQQMVDKYEAGIRHAVIETALKQSYDELRGIAGKLYFKEALVTEINGFLHAAVVRDVHFNSFFIR